MTRRSAAFRSSRRPAHARQPRQLPGPGSPRTEKIDAAAGQEAEGFVDRALDHRGGIDDGGNTQEQEQPPLHRGTPESQSSKEAAQAAQPVMAPYQENAGKAWR